MAHTEARPPLGARRRRFVLEVPVETPDGFGGVLRRYVAGPVLWGAISPVGAVERLQGGRADRLPTHRITLRARPGVTPAARLVAGPRRFAVRHVETGARDLVCHVEELAGSGEAP